MNKGHFTTGLVDVSSCGGQDFHAELQEISYRPCKDGGIVPIEPLTEYVDVIVYSDGAVEEFPIEAGTEALGIKKPFGNPQPRSKH